MIVGGESGPGARPMRADWVRDAGAERQGRTPVPSRPDPQGPRWPLRSPQMISTPPPSTVTQSTPSERCPATPDLPPVQGHPDGGVESHA